jgi:hypothetical protein
MLTAAAAMLLPAAAVAQAPPDSRAACEAAYPASWGRIGKDVPWVPTSVAVMHAMLTMAQVSPQDLVVDLGAGDGRIAIAAAKPPFGARSVGIEYDPQLAKLADCLVRAEGVADRARIVQGDIFVEDFGGASVVTMYLLPQVTLCVRHRILALEPGTRVVSHQYPIAGWEPDQSVQIQGRNVFLWVVPARVDGVWDFHGGQGKPFAIDLRQTFGKIGGEIIRGHVREPLLSAALRGRDIRFTFDADGATAAFTGTVDGSGISGTLSTGGETVKATGRLRDALRPAPWAAMAEGCSRYYGR